MEGMMTVEVLLFAQPREAAGSRSISVNLAPGATYAQLRNQIATDFPQLASLGSLSRIAAGGQFVDDDTPIREGVEIALIPPVSGG